MNKTAIEWCDYTINPVKGLCPVTCSYCYARRMYKRYKWDEDIRFEYASFMKGLNQIKNPSRIFVGSTMELFGEWIQVPWLDLIFEAVRNHPQHTFIFLTKRPENIALWSPFPDNCWIGVSATNSQMVYDSWPILEDVKAKVKFYSFEPLQEAIQPDLGDMLKLAGINWLIIGQQAPVSKKTAPEPAWVQDILVGAHNAGCLPVFIKDNLIPVLAEAWPGWTPLREFPR